MSNFGKIESSDLPVFSAPDCDGGREFSLNLMFRLFPLSPTAQGETGGRMMLRLSFCLSFVVLHISAREIDNGVVGVPTLDCFENGVRLSFSTEKPFTGRIFVKGMPDNPRCSHDFTHSTHTRAISLTFDSVDCAMERQRRPGDNGGIVNVLSILVMFHGTFVTKVDKTYKCMCFFRRQARVTNMIEISEMGVTDLMDGKDLATCRYTLRYGSASGAEIRYARVGDAIYHTWECDDDNLGILVHSCWVTDGTGRRSKFDFYDRHGCAVDPIIMPDIHYDTTLRKAWVEAHGFKFSTSTTLRFSCMLETCKLVSGGCVDVTPPRCSSSRHHPGPQPYRPPPPPPYQPPPPPPPPPPPSGYAPPVRPPPSGYSGRRPYAPPVQTRYEAGQIVFGKPRQQPGYGAGAGFPPAPPPGGGIRIVPRPPDAPRGIRPYRSKRATEIDWNDENAYDVLASITIFDKFEEDDIGFPFALNNLTSDGKIMEMRSHPAGQTCVSTPAFSSLVAVTIVTFITCLITTTYIAVTRRSAK